MSQRLGRAERRPSPVAKPYVSLHAPALLERNARRCSGLSGWRAGGPVSGPSFFHSHSPSACDNADTLNPISGVTPAEAGVEVLPPRVRPRGTTTANATFAARIPGMTAQPIPPTAAASAVEAHRTGPVAVRWLPSGAGEAASSRRSLGPATMSPTTVLQPDQVVVVHHAQASRLLSYIPDGTIIGTPARRAQGSSRRGRAGRVPPPRSRRWRSTARSVAQYANPGACPARLPSGETTGISMPPGLRTYTAGAT